MNVHETKITLSPLRCPEHRSGSVFDILDSDDLTELKPIFICEGYRMKFTEENSNAQYK